MPIVEAKAIAISIPLKKPFTIAVGHMTHSNHVLVKLTDEQGRVGWGETSTFMEVYGYDQKALYEALSRHLLPGIIGMDPSDFAALDRRMATIMPFNYQAKAGVDLAAHDLSAKASGLPLHTLLGGKRVDKVPMIAAIDMVSPDEAREMARQMEVDGYSIIKIKIGNDPVQDLKRVEAVRNTVDDQILLRVDGNTGYDRRSALQVFSPMDHMGLEWIEQPLPAWDLEGHAMLASRLNTPIALDESIYTHHDALQAIKAGAAQVVNLKIVRCGGLYRSQKIATVCQAAGVPCFLGGVLETSPGMASCAHFYTATPNVVSAGEFHGVSHFVDDIVEEPLTMEKGFYRVPEGPGLGVRLDLAKVERYAMDW